MSATLQQQVGAAVVRRAYYWARHEFRTGYTQDLELRWFGIDHHVHWHNAPHHVPPWADCSSSAYWLAWDARCAVRGEPGDAVMGGGWMWGNTTTLKGNGKLHRSTKSTGLWVPGRTLVFYEDHSSHVTTYIGRNLVMSHGQQSGPAIRPFNYRPVSQARLYDL